ncbi:hypothetical protein [Thalassobacillus sp. B23F22_16]|uniref:hypothetical protein n=1 Tax=Thalassobacillus sp. B23F22_16 TaxID=3459513 RepID=UPI00373EAA6A
MVKVVGERKTRSDKKRDIKPFIPVELYECFNRTSYVTNTPIKDIGVMVCKRGLYSAAVMELLSNHFRRDYWASNNTMYIGDSERPPFKSQKGIAKQRMTIRFSQSDHDKLSHLAFSLDSSVSSATGLLLETAFKNTDVINAIITSQVKDELDPNRMKQLREILKFINKNNPYHERITIGEVTSFILEELKGTAFTMSESVKHWMRNL